MNLFFVLALVQIRGGLQEHSAISPIKSTFLIKSLGRSLIPAAMVRKSKSEDKAEKMDQYIGYRVRVEVIMAATGF
jgi:hypothetical protein